MEEMGGGGGGGEIIKKTLKKEALNVHYRVALGQYLPLNISQIL